MASDLAVTDGVLHLQFLLRTWCVQRLLRSTFQRWLQHVWGSAWGHQQPFAQMVLGSRSFRNIHSAGESLPIDEIADKWARGVNPIQSLSNVFLCCALCGVGRPRRELRFRQGSAVVVPLTHLADATLDTSRGAQDLLLQDSPSMRARVRCN